MLQALVLKGGRGKQAGKQEGGEGGQAEGGLLVLGEAERKAMRRGGVERADTETLALSLA
jgi:hypothetical protein